MPGGIWYEVDAETFFPVHRYITPSIFEPLPASVVDEYTLGQQVSNAADILQSHWESWVTLGDFQRIAAAGFNSVRIPIGYWAYQKADGEPYVQGAAPYMDSAIGWARQTGLKVWIDLHGAPLSQNGFDNSGHRIDTPGWGQGDSVAVTLSVLQQIADKYATTDYQDVVVAIELLNEPNTSDGINLDQLKQFYRDGYGNVRQVSGNSNTAVVLQDGFQPASSYDGVLTPSPDNANNVILDHHEYQCFTDEQVALPAWVCFKFLSHKKSSSNFSTGAPSRCLQWRLVLH